VFGYSDEDGTEAEHLPDHLPQEVVDERVERLAQLAEELTAQRAEERHGELLEVLVDAVGGEPGGPLLAEGRAAHQAPEVDGSTQLSGSGLRVGQLVRAVVTGSEGVDLLAEPVREDGSVRAGGSVRIPVSA